MVKDIVSYGTGYKICESGVVYGKDGRKLKQHGGETSKYLAVSLSSDGAVKKFLVHRLVAISFIDNPEGKPQVNHIDGDIFNNRASNLEWVTQSENMIHSYHKLGNKKGCAPMTGKFGSEHNRSKSVKIKTPDGVEMSFGSASEMARETGYSQTAISEAMKTKELPYTFVRGKNKGMTILDYDYQLKVK